MKLSLALAACAGLRAPLQPMEPSPAGENAGDLTTEEIARKCIPGVVTIYWLPHPSASSSEALSLGTAFRVESDLLITNWHVAAADFGTTSAPYMKSSDSMFFPIHNALVAWESCDLDLVVLRLHSDSLAAASTDAPFGEWFQSSLPPALEWTRESPVVGSEIVVIGTPRGLTGTVSTGIASAVRESDRATLVQLTAPVSPGSSGSPVFNRSGEACAVATQQMNDGQLLNFAVPLKYIPGLIPSVGLELDEWARQNCTQAEDTLSLSLYEEAYREVGPKLHELLHSPKHDTGIQAPSGRTVQRAELHSLIARIEEDLPSHLEHGSAHPASGPWSSAAVLLDDMRTQSLSDRLYDLGTEANAAGSNTSRVLGWMCEFSPTRATLERRIELRANDEAAIWTLVLHCGDEAERLCARVAQGLKAKRDLETRLLDEGLRIEDILAGKGSNELRNAYFGVKFAPDPSTPEQIASLADRCAELCALLESHSPGWLRVPAYQHELAQAMLMLGRHEESEKHFCQRVLPRMDEAAEIGASLALYSHDKHHDPHLDCIYDYLLQTGSISPSQALGHISSRRTFAIKIAESSTSASLALRVLLAEMEEILAAVLASPELPESAYWNKQVSFCRSEIEQVRLLLD